ncbi:MAG: hypothetical protein AAF799_02690 [Myxococcota bacterium]
MAIEPEPAPTSVHGEPCDEAPVPPTYEVIDEHCNACQCLDGAWSCFDAGDSCIQAALADRRAEVLVVVDDSSSMGAQRQARLARGLSSLTQALATVADPVRLRVGITTTDLGNPVCDPATAKDGELLVRSCQEHLDDFAPPVGLTEVSIPDDAAQLACEAHCELPELRTTPTPTAVDPTARARPWLERYGETTNIEGDASFDQALACALPQGLRGCDFESPLEATRRALERSQDPSDPMYGFASEDSSLTVLVVTDEVDCSSNEPWDTVFDPEGTRRFWSDPEADAPTSAVCWKTGVQCSGGPGVYDGCEAVNIDTAEHVGIPNDNAVLVPMDWIVRDISRSGPRDINFNVIGGVPIGYSTGEAELQYSDALDDPAQAQQYGVGPGCVEQAGQAMPPVRMLAAASRLGSRGRSGVYSACADDYGPALAQVGQTIADDLDPGCYSACAALDPEPECVVWSEVPQPDGTIDHVELPACEGDRPPQGHGQCYVTRHGDTLTDECRAWGYNLELALRHDPTAVPAGGPALAVCRASESPGTDCGG